MEELNKNMKTFEYKIDLTYTLQDMSDKDRIRLIKEVILSAPNAQYFVEKIKKWLEKVEVD